MYEKGEESYFAVLFYNKIIFYTYDVYDEVLEEKHKEIFD